MKNECVIGTARANAGERATGVIPVGRRSGGGAIEIPLIVVNGVEEGPLLWLDGAVHGDEPEGPLAVLRLVERLDPARLRGTVVGVPVVNVGAFEFSSRGNPADLFTYDLNRIYPGRPDGHLTERIAYAHYTTMVEHADLEVAVHSGGAHSYLAYAMFYTATPSGIELAKAMGPRWDLLLRQTSERGSPQAAMRQHGKPAITVELGGLCDTFPGRFQGNADALAEGFVNILRHYKMIDGAAQYAERWMLGYQKTVVLAPASGLWVSEPSVLRRRVRQGERLATIYSLSGDVVADVQAPFDGIPFGMRTNPSVQLGDWCVFYGVVEEEITG